MDTHVFDTSLTPGDAYWVDVRALINGAWSGWSAVSTISTQDDVPNTPSAPTLYQQFSRRVRVRTYLPFDNGASITTLVFTLHAYDPTAANPESSATFLKNVSLTPRGSECAPDPHRSRKKTQHWLGMHIVLQVGTVVLLV